MSRKLRPFRRLKKDQEPEPHPLDLIAYGFIWNNQVAVTIVGLPIDQAMSRAVVMVRQALRDSYGIDARDVDLSEGWQSVDLHIGTLSNHEEEWDFVAWATPYHDPRTT